MKHLIIGSGTIGYATGVWLESNNQEVIYNDNNPLKIKELKNKKKNTTNFYNAFFDYYWICTPEWELENVLKELSNGSQVIIRCSTIPGTIDKINNLYKLDLVHVPEFLRQHTAVTDIFDPERIIVGGYEDEIHFLVWEFFKKLYPNKPIIATCPFVSELVKLVSNAWLSTQLSFWNEICRVCKEHNTNPQLISELVTLDKRISKYGSNMLHEPFGGMCLPKDLNNLISLFEKNKSILLQAVKEVNEEMKNERRNKT